MLYLNKSIKYVNWDSLDPDSYGALIFKACQSVICIIISYTAMKHFSVSTTSVVCSLSPFFAVFLAWLFLGEHITPYTIISVVIVILCVTMIIFGSEGEQKVEMSQNMIVVFALFCMPVLLAGGMIAARKMKRNHPFSLTCYSNVVLLITSIVGLQLTSE